MPFIQICGDDLQRSQALRHHKSLQILPSFPIFLCLSPWPFLSLCFLLSQSSWSGQGFSFEWPLSGPQPLNGGQASIAASHGTCIIFMSLAVVHGTNIYSCADRAMHIMGWSVNLICLPTILTVVWELPEKRLTRRNFKCLTQALVVKLRNSCGQWTNKCHLALVI